MFCRLAEGGSNQEIADGLYLTERTVRAHLCEIMRELLLRSRLRPCVASYFHAHRSSCPDPVANDDRTRV